MVDEKPKDKSKADHVREYLATHKRAKPEQVVKALAGQDVTVTAKYVRDVKSRTKKRKRRGARKPRVITKPQGGTRPYPRATLEDALLIPRAIKDKNGGNPWAPAQVAKAIGSSKQSTKFFYLAAAARDFGLTDSGRDSQAIGLTDLGRSIVYAPNAQAEQDQKKKAFLNVTIFKKVLEYYKGSSLPEMQYLSNTLSNTFFWHPTIMKSSPVCSAITAPSLALAPASQSQ